MNTTKKVERHLFLYTPRISATLVVFIVNELAHHLKLMIRLEKVKIKTDLENKFSKSVFCIRAYPMHFIPVHPHQFFLL